MRGFGNFTSPKTGRGAPGQTDSRHPRSHSSLENRTGGELVITLSLAKALAEERREHRCRCKSPATQIAVDPNANAGRRFVGALVQGIAAATAVRGKRVRYTAASSARFASPNLASCID